MNNIDLNIDNYKITDLLSFLHLQQTYDQNDLNNAEKEFILCVVSANENNINSQKKYDLLMFIKNAKQLLLNNLTSTKSNLLKEETNVIETQENKPVKIGTIINPNYYAPAMQLSKNAIPIGSYGNGYEGKCETRNYIFNTQFRENFFNTTGKCPYSPLYKGKKVGFFIPFKLYFLSSSFSFSSSN